MKKITGYIRKRLNQKVNEETLESLDRLRRDHPTFFKISLWLFIFLIISIFLKLIYILVKYIYPQFSNHHTFYISELEHIDIVGFFCGVLGIIISFLITLFVEKNHHEESLVLQEESKALKEESKALKDATSSIKVTTEEIFNKFTSLVILNDFSDRLNVYEEIVGITEKSQEKHQDKKNWNHVYVLNYNASYGHVQSFNTTVILNDQRVMSKSLESMTYENFHEKIRRTFFRGRQSELFRRLKNMEGSNTIHFAILKTKTHVHDSSTDKFRQLLIKMLNNVEIHPYDENSNKPITFPLQTVPTKDLYLLPKDFKQVADKEDKDLLIEKIIDYNKEKIRELEDRNIEVAYLDYIPFQFIVTSPKNENVNSKRLALIIFTNILSSGNHAKKTIAFRSESKELIQNLINIHGSLATKYFKDLEEKEKFDSLFNCKENKISFVIKRIPDTSKNGKENDYMAYLPDIDCYSDLRELFNINGHEVKLLYDDELMENGIDKLNKNETYIVIGLFKNKVTECFNDPANENILHIPKSYFRIRRYSHKTKYSYFTNEIRIAKSKVNKNILADKIEWVTYQKKDDFDYGLLTKIKDKNSNKTFFICGGLTSKGTKRIGDYIKNNWAKIIDKESARHSFTILFKIPLVHPHEKITIENIAIFND